ncbi:hypothetical protein Efla_003980 [Eimeria flavescens]
MAGHKVFGGAAPAAKRSPAASPPQTIRAIWTNVRTSRSTGRAELERERRFPLGESEAVNFLSWSERQRLVDAPAFPLLPVLVAIGMLCVVSMSFTVPGNEKELPILLAEREEVPFVPHEAELMAERMQQPRRGGAAAAQEDERLSLSLLQKKREFLLKDEGHKSLDWLEKPLPLGDILIKGKDRQILLTDASSHLAPSVHALLKQARELRRRTQGAAKLADLLQQDLIAVGEFMLLCRILAEGRKLNEEQTKRLMTLFQLVFKRFGSEWPEALTMTRYCADVEQCHSYLRLVSVVVRAAEAASNYFFLGYGKDEVDSYGSQEEKYLKKLMTERLELHRALEEARFPVDVAEIFRTD